MESGWLAAQTPLAVSPSNPQGSSQDFENGPAPHSLILGLAQDQFTCLHPAWNGHNMRSPSSFPLKKEKDEGGEDTETEPKEQNQNEQNGELGGR